MSDCVALRVQPFINAPVEVLQCGIEIVLDGEFLQLERDASHRQDDLIPMDLI
jgi:hypothetical protein